MHWLRLVLFVLFPLLLTVAAPVLLLWAWGNNMPLLPALLLTALSLSLALALHLLGQFSHPHDTDIDALWHEVETLRQQLRQVQVAGTRQVEAGPAAVADNAGANATASVAQEADAAHQAVQSAASTTDAGQQPLPVQTAPSVNASHAPFSPSVPPAAPEGFQLYMEPVNALNGQYTALYRALPALPAEGQAIHLGRHAQLRARTLGQAAALQWHTMLGCLRFARALRERNCPAPVICPLDVAVLEQPGNGALLLSLLQEDDWRMAAQEVLLPSLPLEELMRSGRTARRVLLELEALVNGFVLEHATLPMPDAPLPLALSVRHVDVPAAALQQAGVEQAETVVRAWQERGVGIIASGIDDAELPGRLHGLAALGRGRHIGPPRRVRLPQEKQQAVHGQSQQPGSNTSDAVQAGKPSAERKNHASATSASAARRVLAGG